MKLSDFDFDLPDKLIATRPARPRTASRFLVAQGRGEALRLSDHHVSDLAQFLRPGDRLVLNDTRVIPARLTGVRRRESAQGLAEARIEVTLLDPSGEEPGAWRALLKPLRKVRDGEEIDFSPEFRARVTGRVDGTATLAFNLTGDAFDAALAESGDMPLPPYIAAKRPADAIALPLVPQYTSYETTALSPVHVKTVSLLSMFVAPSPGIGSDAKP